MNEEELKGKPLWKLIFKSNRKEMLSYVVIFIIIIIFGFSTGWVAKTDKFALMVQATTLFGLAWIKLSQIKQQWISQTPDYLTVEYTYKGQVQIKAELIPLVSLSGVREQVQAIAKALNSEANVALYPVLHKIEHGKIIKLDHEGFEHNGQPIELHKTTIELKNKLPELVDVNPKTKDETPARLSEYGVNLDLGEYLYWTYPFKDSDIQINNAKDQFVRLANTDEVK